jgi:outer membrane protein
MMKRTLKPFWLLLVLVIMAFPAVASSDTLSLEDCVSLAKKGNLDLIRAKTSIERAETGITDAYSVYYPDISASSNYSYGKGQVGEGSYSSGISARYQLFKGDTRASIKIARAKVEVAEENYRLSESTILYELKRIFFQIIQQQEQVSRIETILERRRQSLAIIKLRYNVGRESFPAVKEAEANLFRAEYDQMMAEEELSLSKISLNLLLARPKKQEIDVTYEERDIELPPLDEVIEYAKSSRPEIRVEGFNKNIIEAQITQAKSSYLPSVSLSSSYGIGGNEFLEQRGNWSVGVGLSIPIFDGFSTKAKVTDATLSLKDHELKMQDLTQGIEEEVEQAWVNWKLARKNVEVSKKTLEAAQEMYQLTELQYEQGLTSYFFLQQKEDALTNAEYSHVSALYNLRMAIAAMEKAGGRRIQ